jgi:hypothetical protein
MYTPATIISKQVGRFVAGLGTDDQKSAAHATTPIVTAFNVKICISHRKNGLLNRLPAKVSYSIFD